MIARLKAVRERIADTLRSRREACITSRTTRKHYYVGDIAPDSLLNREPGTIIGAFVAVDPETKRITAIFSP